MLRAHFIETYDSDPDEWGSIAYCRIEAHWLVAFAMTDDEQADIDKAREAREQRRRQAGSGP